MDPHRFSGFMLVLVLMVGLDSFAREPIKSPLPVKQLGEVKDVRARDLGVPFDGTPGKLNSITDVPGVEVGYTTLISGDGKLEIGKGPVRTGVTAIIPRGHDSLNDPVYAGYFSLNGNGEMTGTAWLDESGFLEGPIVITNTHSVGVARDAVIAWRLQHGAADKSGYWWSLPVVAETWDGWLNDINGFHVTPNDVAHALDTAKGGPVAEGSVGGGTGMICYEFKGGTGTASRVIVAGGVEPGRSGFAKGAAATGGGYSCFANPVHADVMIDGRKVAGAAQRRTRWGLLQQGSIQNISIHNELAQRFAGTLSADCRWREITEKLLQRARELARQKYGADSWLRKR